MCVHSLEECVSTINNSQNLNQKPLVEVNQAIISLVDLLFMKI